MKKHTLIERNDKAVGELLKKSNLKTTVADFHSSKFTKALRPPLCEESQLNTPVKTTAKSLQEKKGSRRKTAGHMYSNV